MPSRRLKRRHYVIIVPMRVFFRRQLLLPIALVLVLGTLLVAKFWLPSQLRAGEARIAQALPALSTGSASCSVPNVFDYVSPRCGSTPGSCPTIGASVILSDGTREIGNIPNQIVWLNDIDFQQKSGSGSFNYKRESDRVRFAQDNVWGGFSCTNGKKAMYRVFEGNTLGATRYLGSMACGQTVSSNQTLRTYEYNPIVETAPNGQLNTCTVPNFSDTTNNAGATLIWGGKALCNPGVNGNTPFDIIVFKNAFGPGAGEVYVYVKDRGLAAFYEKLDESQSQNQPSSWNSSTDLCALKSATEKSTYFEYNLERDDKNKILNNLYDEYSVSCVPRAVYQLVAENNKRCSELPRGCGNWNTSSELTLSPKGQLFGLLRDEQKAKERAKENSPENPSRLESIESYLSSRQVLTSGSNGTPQSNPTSAASFSQGAASQPVGETIDTSPYQAPIFKNTSPETQCDFIMDKLLAVEELCNPQNRIPGDTPGCPANANIGKFGFTNELSLLNQIKGQSCQQLMNPAANDTRGKEIRSAIMSVNPTMETAYRPAFLVVATKVDGETEANSRFKSQGKNSELPFTQIDYLEIKVPAFGSDFVQPTSTKSNEKNNSARYFRDPLRLTADLFFSPTEQEKYRKQEETDRNAMRNSGATMYAPIISGTPEQVRCRTATGEYTPCNSTNDPLHESLITFINANSALSPQNLTPAWGLPCDADEADFYPDPEKKPAEEVGDSGSIGSDLKAEDVGNYTKKTEAVVEIQGQVRDMSKDVKREAGKTAIFFITPHNYNLQYAQSAFLSLLSPEQQQQLKESAEFPPVLRTGTVANIAENPTFASKRGTTPPASGAPSGSGAPSSPPQDDVTVKLSLGLLPDQKGEERKIPVLWQSAGHIASLPTRLFTLLSTSINEEVNQYTRGCKGPTATLDWLQGNCEAEDVAQEDTGEDSYDQSAQYCIDWKPQASTIAAIKSAAQSRLAGFGYTTPFRRDTDYYQARYQQVLSVNSQGITVASLGDPTNANYFEDFYGGGRALLWTRHPQCGGKICYDYIMDTCAAAGYNPALCVAMNLSESGGSNWIRFPGSYDFGCLSATPNSISSGLDCIVNKFFGRTALQSMDYNEMFKEFAGEGLKSPSYRRIQDWYQKIAGSTGYQAGACQ